MSQDLIEIIKYRPEFKNVWDEFVESSKNGTFLFNRDFMDYHSDRFKDYSLMIYRKGKPYCLFPACIIGNFIYSHAGLTYGGLIMSSSSTAEGILQAMEQMTIEMRNKGIEKIIYSPVPHIYHLMPSEEDIYSLFRLEAKLITRNISSAILLKNDPPFYKDRKSALKKALKNGIEVKQSQDFKTYWSILESNLTSKYNASPVHSLDEILQLAGLFPENIKLWCAFKDTEMIAGAVCFYTHKVVHTQYISANETGKKMGAVDLIIYELIETLKKETGSIKYFDLGTSNGQNGMFLNTSLIYQKEGFGGRGICYDTYELEL